MALTACRARLALPFLAKEREERERIPETLRAELAASELSERG